jgi:hypothetical protein
LGGLKSWFSSHEATPRSPTLVDGAVEMNWKLAEIGDFLGRCVSALIQEKI